MIYKTLGEYLKRHAENTLISKSIGFVFVQSSIVHHQMLFILKLTYTIGERVNSELLHLAASCSTERQKSHNPKMCQLL